MVFTSVTFLYVFLPVTLILYYLIPGRKWKNFILLVLSLLFYAWGEPVFVLVMLLSIMMNWLFGVIVSAVREKNDHGARMTVFLAAVFNLTVIFMFKYLNFAVDNLNYILHTQISVPEIALPVGISFFTFQALSYVIDIYRGNGKAQKNPMNVGLYISFFPQLIAGPIVRYETVAEQMENRKESFSKFSEGVLFFVRGFCKKVLLANNMAIVADKAFGMNPGELSTAFAWLGALAYTFQIFFDFSGYSEMAIGLGKMFGFEFLPNFNYPYISRSISEFWRRWHISLGTWFRDYVYFPLGGSRVKSRARLVFNLFVVWGLTGVWHGASWNFILWGLMYFVLIAFEKLTGFDRRKKERKANFLMEALSWLYTGLFVVVGWVLFRAEGLRQAAVYLKAMLGIGNGAGLTDYMARFYVLEYSVFFLACICCSVPLAKLAGEKLRRIEPLKYLIYAVLFLVSISYLIKGSYNPFIYFNF